MSPACEALAALFRRHPGQWIDHSRIYEAAKHNASARVSDLRKHGFKIEQRGAGERSEYRCVFDPGKQTYRYLRCPSCGFEGDETKVNAAHLCQLCGSEVMEIAAPVQEVLFA